MKRCAAGMFVALLTGVVGSLLGAALTSGRPGEDVDVEDAVREVA